MPALLRPEDYPALAKLPELRSALQAPGVAVLSAPPGAGKTTALPLALLDEPWLHGKTMVMLEPRRIAARMAAQRMAELSGTSPGELCGYSIRLERRVSAATRIETVTEGVLTRRLQNDPELAGVGLLIFDEFHERSVHADLALALALEVRQALRPDLRILVMSATLDLKELSVLLDDSPVIEASGRLHPIEIIYSEEAPPLLQTVESCRRRPHRFAEDFTRFVFYALRESAGDVLVFLPGEGEIRRVAAALETRLPAGVVIVSLFGNLPLDAQQAALARDRLGRRKVTLSTNVAETSLTIDGVEVVIDSGLMRLNRFDAARGADALRVEMISLASATQRAGRAGRQAPGKAFRYWSARAEQNLPPQNDAEIRRVDLCGLALELAAWGVANATALRWLDQPPAAAFGQAKELLIRLGALDHSGAITAHGKAMASLPLHPRLARMLLGASPAMLPQAARIAALSSERDPFRREASAGAVDLERRLQLLDQFENRPRGEVAQILRSATSLVRQAEKSKALVVSHGEGAASPGALLALAYPDRIGRRRGPGQYLLASGMGAVLPAEDNLSEQEFLAIGELEVSEANARVRQAAALRESELRDLFADELRRRTETRFDARTEKVETVEELCFGAIVLERRLIQGSSPVEIEQTLLAALRQAGLAALQPGEGFQRFCARVEFLRSHGEELPACDESTLLDSADEWLLPFAPEARSLRDLRVIPLIDALRARFHATQLRRIEEGAPEHWTTPGGSMVAVLYAGGEARIAVRLQELFGLADTPRLAFGRAPVILELLSPAMRPIQITGDLRSFWDRTYGEVRKELRGRYPKHAWPEDPWRAPPQRGSRRRS